MHSLWKPRSIVWFMVRERCILLKSPSEISLENAQSGMSSVESVGIPGIRSLLDCRSRHQARRNYTSRTRSGNLSSQGHSTGLSRMLHRV